MLSNVRTVFGSAVRLPFRQQLRRIQGQRARGDSLRKIADALNTSEVPTAQGGARWYAAIVRQLLHRIS